MRRAIFIVILMLFGFGVGLYLQESRQANRIQQEQTIELPADYSKVAVSDSFYLYGSNEPLDDLLFDIDLHFKTQGLISDKDAEAITFSQKLIKSNATVDRCIEFRYFTRDRAPALSFTIIPKDSSCYTGNEEVAGEIKNLRQNHVHIFTVELVESEQMI